MKFWAILVLVVILAGGAYIYFEKSFEDESVQKIAERAGDIGKKLELCAPDAITDTRDLEDLQRFALAFPAFTIRSPFKNFQNEILYYIYLKSYSRNYLDIAEKLKNNSFVKSHSEVFFANCPDCKNGKPVCDTCKGTKVCTLCNGSGLRTFPGGSLNGDKGTPCSRKCTFCPTDSTCRNCDGQGKIANYDKLNDAMSQQYDKVSKILSEIIRANTR